MTGSDWLHVGRVKVLLFMLVDDVCRLDLLRGPAVDTLRMTHESYSEADGTVEVPTCSGSDREAALRALVGAAQRGRLDPGPASGGLLDADEIEAALQMGWAMWRGQCDSVRDTSRWMEATSPSRIIAVAREVGLHPEPTPSSAGDWTARCPGTNHALMIATGSEQFGCGYCKVKGGPEQLAAFARRRGT